MGRGRKVNLNSARQQKLARFAEKRAAGIDVKRGRPKKVKREEDETLVADVVQPIDQPTFGEDTVDETVDNVEELDDDQLSEEILPDLVGS